MKKSLYDILGVPQDASVEAIREAYEARSARADGSDAGQRVALKEALSVLTDVGRRAGYDAYLREAAARSEAARSAPVTRPVRAESAHGAPESAGRSRVWPLAAVCFVVLAGGGWWFSRGGESRGAASSPPAKVAATTQITVDRSAAPAVAAVRKPLAADALFALASRSIMRIEVTDRSGNPMSLGSGVVIEPDVVITNCHVVDGGHGIKVKHGDVEVDARLDLADEQHDLCRLRTLGLDAPAVERASVADVHVGQKVYAIGAPRGLDLTLSDGLVSSLRQVEQGRLIQTTAPVSPGSSGGGLFNERGQLIGIVTFQYQGQNLNFALPADWIATLSATRVERASERERDDDDR